MSPGISTRPHGRCTARLRVDADRNTKASSAPSSRRIRSIIASTSTSVMPTRSSEHTSSKASSEISEARRNCAISSSSFDLARASSSTSMLTSVSRPVVGHLPVLQGVQLADTGPAAGPRPRCQGPRGADERRVHRDHLGRRAAAARAASQAPSVYRVTSPSGPDDGGRGPHRLEAGQPDDGIHVREQVTRAGDEHRALRARLPHRVRGLGGAGGVDGGDIVDRGDPVAVRGVTSRPCRGGGVSSAGGARSRRHRYRPAGPGRRRSARPPSRR